MFSQLSFLVYFYYLIFVLPLWIWNDVDEVGDNDSGTEKAI